MDIKVNIENILPFVSMETIKSFQNEIYLNQKAIENKTGEGSDFLGWVNLPSEIDNELFAKINKTVSEIKNKAEVFIVIGIGGSYLGARAVIEALGHNFYDLKEKKDFPYVVFAGQNISEEYIADLLEVLENKNYALAVISKSGTTTEPAIAFRILKNNLEKKYGKAEACTRIIAITDSSKGALRKLSESEGYSSFIIPDDVGGRYSVFTPVGLLPVAMAGFDVVKLVDGAKTAQQYLTNNFSLYENPASLYAVARNCLYRVGKPIEVMVSFQPNLSYVTEWWKQLYGESEGKRNRGIFPAGVNFTTDLHSMGQYLQDGLRVLFETVVSVEKPAKEMIIPFDDENSDGLNFIAGKRLNEVNKMAELGTMLAHIDGGVPNIKITIPEINEYYLGQLLYFFEYACALSGYMLGVNPFDQPGVEAYKNNMFALLGKPGFEESTKEISKRIIK